MSHAAASVFGALLHFVWQGALLALALWAVLRATRAPGVRYVAACGALAAMAVAPVATFGALYASATGVAAASPPAARILANADAFDPRILVIAAWGAGVLAMLARLVSGLIDVRSIVRGARPLHAWEARVTAIAARFGVRRRVRVLESSRVEAPSTVGWLRPVVLLPAALVLRVPEAVIEAAIAHELVHVRRFDYLVNVTQSIVEALLFYHPLVHWVGRRIREEREASCDEAVVAVSGDAAAYARALLALAELRLSRPRLGLASTGGPLMSRVRRLFEVSSRASRVPAVVACAASLFALAVVPLAACASRAEETPAATQASAIRIPWLPESVKRFAPEIADAARRHGVDPELVAVVLYVESRGDPAAKSPAGAIGLMQVMPATARRIAEERGLPAPTEESLRDPKSNLDFGAYFLAKQLGEFKTVDLAAAAYNAGPTQLRAHLADGSPLEEETTNYRAKVASLYRARHDAARP